MLENLVKKDLVFVLKESQYEISIQKMLSWKAMISDAKQEPTIR